MSEIIGRQIEAGIGVEYTRGSEPAGPEKWFKNVMASIVERAEKVVDDNKRGVMEDSEGARVIKKWIEGELSGILHADAIGYILYNLYGAVSSSNVAGSVYSHEFTVPQNNIEHASLSIYAKDGAVQQKVYTNGMVSTLELSASVDDYIRFTANFLAKQSASNSDTPSYDTEYDFIARDIVVKMADSEAGLSGASAIKVKNISVNWDTGLIRDHVVGSYFPDDLYDGKMSIEGEFTLNFDATTYKDLFLADTYKYMQIAITGETDIGGGNYPTLTILFYKVGIMDWNREGGNDELVTQTVRFKAFYRASDSGASKVTLQNLTTEYDTAVSA